MSEFDRQKQYEDMGADISELLYCDHCCEEISEYQNTIGEGLCSECKACDEMEEL